MKGTFGPLFVAVVFFLILQPDLTMARQSTDLGTVEGVVLLAAKENPVRVGGRYGRPSRSSGASSSSTDSVLIWLESTEANSGSEQSGPVILDQKGLSFQPSVLPVRLNGTVRIRNSDPVYHNVFSLSPKNRFDVGRRPKGEYLDVTFDTPGAVDVFCDIHSNMRATIYVMPPRVVTWTKVKSGDSFTIEDVEAGNYQLKVYALGFQERVIPVEIVSGEAATVGTLTLSN
ncbi:hypothetical protein [Gracilimonas sediminicola]|uniref:Rhamnogalacturonan lyase domain-containing protein n=1 Tax=Gracilimonas sediminicola TaxID=2952158 RepID=A0A9X2L125_9BACT|nr:hypothetical protein [Gracilimonas sediminicola]MCP9290378.1 hypothetical protein [Gracilimonas sediminicola]